jgi:hypothetical protein
VELLRLEEKKAELCKEVESTLDIGDLRRPESIENTVVKI